VRHFDPAEVVKSRLAAISAPMSGSAESGRRADIGRLSKSAIPVIAAIRGTEFIELSASNICRAQSFRLDPGVFDDRAPHFSLRRKSRDSAIAGISGAAGVPPSLVSLFDHLVGARNQ
jgi:hypothetical protein